MEQKLLLFIWSCDLNIALTIRLIILMFKQKMKYRCISINLNVVLKLNQFTISTNKNMVTCQSANQLKTPAKVSWAFKIVSQFGSLGHTIMGKTADLTVVQKTIIDTLHKEGKPHTFIAKEAGCSQSAVSKHVNRELSGRKKCERKRCKTNQETRSLMRIVKQNQIKNLGELHKEWTEAGVKASRATTQRRVKEFGYSCRQRCLTWAKEKKNWTVLQSPLFRWEQVLYFIWKPRS